MPLESPQMEAYLNNRPPASITIEVKNLPASAAPISVGYRLVNLVNPSPYTQYAQLNKAGVVTIVLEDNLPYQQIRLSIDSFFRQQIVVNSNLHIRINASKANRKERSQTGYEIVFSGTDGELNTVLSAHEEFRKNERSGIEEHFIDLSTKTSNKKVSMASFLQTADSVYRQLQAIDDAFIAQYPNYGEIVRNETNSLFYGLYCHPFSYREIPAPMWEKIRTHQPYFMSANARVFYQFLSNVTINNSQNGRANIQQLLYTQYATYNPAQQSILDSIRYYEGAHEEEKEKNKEALKDLYIQRWKHLAGEQTLLMAKHHIKIIDSTYTGTRADLLKLCLLNGLKNYYATTYPLFQAHLATDWSKKLVGSELAQLSTGKKGTDSLYAIAQKKTQNQSFIGRPLAPLAFGAELYRLDSIEQVTDFIINLQAKFKGKAIIIDFWATWCVPCLKDMRGSRKLHNDNKDLPLEYVYLCTNYNSDERTWRKHVEELQLPGTHIFVDDVIIKGIKKRFNAEQSYPAYVVIDLAGNASAAKINHMAMLNRNSLKNIIGMP